MTGDTHSRAAGRCSLHHCAGAECRGGDLRSSRVRTGRHHARRVMLRLRQLPHHHEAASIKAPYYCPAVALAQRETAAADTWQCLATSYKNNYIESPLTC